MEKYTEYRALMLVNGRWLAARHWNGQILPSYKNKDDCVNAVLFVVDRWKKQAPDKPLPEKWTLQYREVTTTDWLEYLKV